MDLSVVIVSWNVREMLERCLDSIAANCADLNLQVIVVDNDSHDGTVEMLRRRPEDLVIVANDWNAGFTRGNNQGFALAVAEKVLMLNPDTEIVGSAVHQLIAFLDGAPDVGIVGPILLAPDRSITPTGSRFPTFAHELLGLTGLRALLRRDDGYGRADFTVTTDVDVVCGACLMTRRAVLNQIGGLDESLFMFYEEVDFCLRAARTGWRRVYLAEARVIHYWMGSVRQDMIGATRRLFESQFIYFRKHHGVARASALRALSLFTVASRAGRITAVRFRDRLLTNRKVS